jgi:dihydroxyacetone kinase
MYLILIGNKTNKQKNFLCVDDVRTSQEAHASTTCHRDHKETIKREDGKKWTVVSDTTGGGGGTEFVIGFEGSQALTVCPSGKCKHLTGTIEV